MEILGTVLLNVQLPLTHANHTFPAMPDGRDRSSIAFLWGLLPACVWR